MTATINLSLDIPRSYSVTLLKKQLTEYAKQLIAHATAKEEVAPYTIEELHERLAESEAQYAAGEYYSQDEVHTMMNEFVRGQSTL